MSAWTVARIPRVAFVLASVAILLAGTLGMAAPASGVSLAPPGSILAPIGHITPTALGPGAPATNRPSFAPPFRTLDPGALRAAKLRAAAIASRGSRGPSLAPLAPLAGLFNNLDSPGLNQVTVAPPDSTGAIGPNNYVEMVNQEIGVYDRKLNLISSTDNGTFTGAGASLTVTDPQIQWDGQSGHWLYAALGVATGANMLIFGWSKTSDPSDLTNGWCRFGTPRGNLLDDYPKLGHDDNFISIGTNVYNDSTNAFVTANIFAIRKPAAGDTSCSVGTVFYVADAAHPLHNADGSIAFTPVPANTADASAFGYVVAAHSPVDGTGSSAPKIMVWHWALVGGAPALVSDGDVTVPTFDIPAPVPQPGTSYTLDSLDARLTQAVAVNDPGAGGAKGIWTQHTVAGPGGRSVVRWYEILGGTPPTLRQQGDVGSPTDFVFNGAVSPSIGGDSAAVFYNRGGASTLPVIGAQTRSAATPLGSLDTGELLIGQSTAADVDFTCSYSSPTAPCRWGDYAGASPDPLNDGIVWGSSQVTGPCYIGFCGLFAQWQTQNFAVVASTLSATPGSLVLAKALTGGPNGYTGPFTIHYACGSATSGNAVVAAGASLTISGIPAGTSCTVSEPTLPTPPTGYSFGTPTFSPSATVSVPAGGSVTVTTNNTLSATSVVPSAPQNLTAVPASRKGVQLTWQPPLTRGSSPITAYRVYRGNGSSPSSFTLVATLGVVTSYTDTSTARRRIYTYYVVAVNAAGPGPASNKATAPAT
jgi:Domain of unknown function (DUF5979)/Fibronectin type III domain